MLAENNGKAGGDEGDTGEDEDGDLPGLIGKEQPLFFFGPPPAIAVTYKGTGYDKEFHPADLIEHMRNGKTRSEIVACWGIKYTTFNEWIEAYPELAEAYAIGIPAFEAYYKATLRYVSFGMMPKANAFSLHFMLKNLAGFDENGGSHEFAEAQNAELEFVDDE